MTCLDATFTLTPLSPDAYGTLQIASLECFGADFLSWSQNLGWADANNRFYFDAGFRSDPTLDYTQWTNRRNARHLEMNLYFYPSAQANNKQVALIFGFSVLSAPSARVQVYSDAALLSDQTLNYGDSQFLILIDPPTPGNNVTLYFVHVGGFWTFSGISGYLV